MATIPEVIPLDRALEAAAEAVAAIGEAQWTDPTPCTEWNLRVLVNHLVTGNHFFAALLGEKPPPLEDLLRQPDKDLLGSNAVQALRDSADAQRISFSRPGVLEQVFDSPVGAVPGHVLLDLRITEALVHGWDIAKAVGRPVRFPDDVAERALAFSQRALGNIPRGRRFGEVKAAGTGATAIDRLAGFLGRPLDWPAESG